MRYLMGLDSGGTLVKAAIFDEYGNQLCAHSESTDLICERAGFTERNMNELWLANAGVVKKCIEKSGLNPKSIVAVAISGHGKGLYVTDSEGNIIRRGIVSTDTRAESYVKKWKRDKTAERIYEKTFQNILACQPAPLLRWIKDNENEIYKKIGRIYSVKDYLRFKLTGESYAEITDISGTNLLNLVLKDYDNELLKEFGIEEMFDSLLPIKNSFEFCGRVTDEAAEITGLNSGTVVGGGMFDINACAIAMGINDSKNICVIGGTWSINEYIAEKPVTDGTISMNSLFCLPQYYLIEECSPTGAGNLNWMKNMFFDGLSYSEIDLIAEEGELSIDTPVYHPFLFASNENENLTAGLYDFTAATTKSNILRSIFEGIVFSHKSHIDKLLLSRSRPDAIRLAGGVCNSAFWCQMFADILGIKIETVQGKELGCLGAAISAGVAAGVYPDANHAILATFSVNKTYLPNEENKHIYLQKYKKYRSYID